MTQRFFYDTEFLEGSQKRRIFGFELPSVFDTHKTIDLISIGIVSEDGNREYYAISKDFNLKEAWNRYDIVKHERTIGFSNNIEIEEEKVYWIRENVLKPIFVELFIQDNELNKEICQEQKNKNVIENKMTFYWLQQLITKYGKTNKQIAEEIKEFVAHSIEPDLPPADYFYKKDSWIFRDIEFFAYYSAYDHIVLSWLYGKMINLPKGFPQYTIDLKQELERLNEEPMEYPITTFVYDNKYIAGIDPYFSKLQDHPNYPKQTNEHNALSDAKFNRELYLFLKNL